MNKAVCCALLDNAQTVSQIMRAHGVRFVPVVADENSAKLLGVITDRDLCSRVMAEGNFPEVIPVERVMTSSPVTCAPEQTPGTCKELMVKHNVRRLPVVDAEGRCLGVVGLADLPSRPARASRKAANAPPAQRRASRR